jgi:integrase/recombinase XerC
LKKFNINTLLVDWVHWLEHEKRLSSNTLSAYKRDLKSFLLFLKKHHGREVELSVINKLDEKDLRAWFFSKMKNGVVSRSNARSLSSIKSFVLFLVKNKTIIHSKILSMKSPKYSIALPRPLSTPQVEKIISSIKKNKILWVAKRNLLIIFLMWGFGMRINEVLNLKIKDIGNDDFISVPGKGGKERIIPIYHEIKKKIREMLNIIPFNLTNNGFIFLGEKGKKLHPSIIQKEIRRIRNEVMLPENTTPHSFRHSFASLLLENMVDLRSIQELLGHKSLSSTMKYTAVSSNQLKKIIDSSHPRSGKKL